MTMQLQDIVNRLNEPIGDLYKIYLDTCSLTNPNFGKFWDLLDKAIKITPNQVICYVTYKVKSELQCFSEGVRPATKYRGIDPSKLPPVSESLKNQSKEALLLIDDLVKKKHITQVGVPDNPFADKDITNRVYADWSSYSTLVITEDHLLRETLSNIPALSPATHYSHKISSLRVADFFPSNEPESAQSDTTKTDSSKIGPVKEKDIIGNENEVYVNGVKHVLGSPIGNGGAEGCVYNFDESDLVCKIFNEKKLTEQKQTKIKKIVSMKFSFPTICFPKEVVTNKKGFVIGYLMKKAAGKEMSIIEDPDEFTSAFKNWNRVDVVNLAKTFADAFQYLHFHGILVCDFNPTNYLIVSPKEIYLIDTDSFQYPDFPSSMTSIGYVAPENLTSKYNPQFKTIRSVISEDFGIAVVMFYLLTLGHHPYCGNPSEMSYNKAVKEGLFLFPGPISNNLFSKSYYENVFIDGCGKYWWSFPKDLRRIFYETFAKDGLRYNNRIQRLSPGEWSIYLSNYSAMLTKYLIKYNNGFGSLIPADYLKNDFNTGIDLAALDTIHIKSPDMDDNNYDVSLYFQSNFCTMPGFSHNVDSNSVKNIINTHTPPKVQTPIAQKPVTKNPHFLESNEQEGIGKIKQEISSISKADKTSDLYKSTYQNIKIEINDYLVELFQALSKDYTNLLYAKTIDSITTCANNIIAIAQPYTNNTGTLYDFTEKNETYYLVNHVIAMAFFAKKTPSWFTDYVKAYNSVQNLLNGAQKDVLAFRKGKGGSSGQLSDKIRQTLIEVSKTISEFEKVSRTNTNYLDSYDAIKALKIEGESAHKLGLYLEIKDEINLIIRNIKKETNPRSKRKYSFNLGERCLLAKKYLYDCPSLSKDIEKEETWIAMARLHSTIK
jgi:hypothetical protein